MERLTVLDIVNSTKGNLVLNNASYDVSYISTDSREQICNSLFIALVGDKFNGHDFLEDAYNNGVRVFVINKEYSFVKPDISVITVDDTLYALGDIAKFYREKFVIPFIGVTGSVGKTSTKDMIFSVLNEKYNCLKNEGNLNNEIGLPKTIFNLSNSNEVAVLEMGMDHKGQIKHMASIVHPKIGVISNIGTAHIEFFDNQDGIFDAKMEITSFFDEDSLLVVNGDDNYLKKLKDSDFSYRVLSYGFNSYNDIYIESYNIDEDSSTFTFKYNDISDTFTIPSPAKHNILNALASIVIGLEMNLSLSEIKNGLLNLKLSKSRMDIFKTSKYKVINDAYNASLDSVVAGLEVLSNNNTRKVAILGDILECGSYSKMIHEEIGKNVCEKTDVLITVGEASKNIDFMAIKCGFDSNNLYHFDSYIDVINNIDSILCDNDTILIKASNGIKLEEVSNYLRKDNEN